VDSQIAQAVGEGTFRHPGSEAGQHWDAGRPSETEEQRADRNLAELLQELRVAAIGVQVLFGFLLSLPLSARFGQLDHAQRALYGVSLGSAATATALLVGPVAYHRLVFRQHQKRRLVKVANALALAGLATVGVAMTTAMWLILSVVYHGVPVALAGWATVAVYLFLWVLLPVSGRRR
jgi:hypothetical protein